MNIWLRFDYYSIVDWRLTDSSRAFWQHRFYIFALKMEIRTKIDYFGVLLLLWRRTRKRDLLFGGWYFWHVIEKRLFPVMTSLIIENKKSNECTYSPVLLCIDCILATSNSRFPQCTKYPLHVFVWFSQKTFFLLKNASNWWQY